MRKQVLSIVSILSLLLTLAIAGSANSGSFKVNIPFDFMVGKTQLKAGSYIVDSNRVRDVPQIINEERRTGIFVSTFGGKSSSKPSRAKLVFHRYGGQYF